MRENLKRETLGGTHDKKVFDGGMGPWGLNKFHWRNNNDLVTSSIDKIITLFFITKFLDHANIYDLWKLFARFGRVGEVFVFRKLDKWGRQSGFVKFKEVRDE